MEILYIETCDSTQDYLIDLLHSKKQFDLLIVYTYNQTNGYGSRGNLWFGEKGNLFFSFAIKKELLPQDLCLQSASIYFSYLLKMLLAEIGSCLWVKWPNDFYIGKKKIGGTITSIIGNHCICGIGINLYRVKDFGHLDIKIDVLKVLNSYAEMILKSISWKDVFIKYRVEFEINKYNQFELSELRTISLDFTKVVLLEDGSLKVNGKKVYGLR